MRVEAVDHNGNPLPGTTVRVLRFVEQVVDTAERMFVCASGTALPDATPGELANACLQTSFEFWQAATEMRDNVLERAERLLEQEADE
jgi:hypothetical protein